MNLWIKYLRWRHSKGYGVHSPYAYRFVTDVLRAGPYSYYSYQEIDAYLSSEERHDYRFQNLIKFIIRLAVFLKSKRIAGFSETFRICEITAKALGIESINLNNECNLDCRDGDLLILDHSLKDTEVIAKVSGSGASVFALNASPQLRQSMNTPKAKGLLLKDKKKMILVPRHEMEYVAYDIDLRARS